MATSPPPTPTRGAPPPPTPIRGAATPYRLRQIPHPWPSPESNNSGDGKIQQDQEGSCEPSFYGTWQTREASHRSSYSNIQQVATDESSSSNTQEVATSTSSSRNTQVATDKSSLEAADTASEDDESEDDESEDDESEDDESEDDESEDDESENDESEDDESEDDHISRAVRIIDDLYKGGCLSDDETFTLSPSSYDFLRQSLDSHLLEYFDNEVRSNWDPITGKLTIRAMAEGPLHSKVCSDLYPAMKEELSKISAKYPDLESSVKKLSFFGCAGVGAPKSVASHGRRGPDGQFRYKGHGATLVYEVACTQGSANVQEKAQQYFRWASEVQLVLIIDITKRSVDERREGYKHPAKVSLWSVERGNGAPEDIKTKPLLKPTAFRDSNGGLTKGSLKIPYKLLLPPRERTNNRAMKNAKLTLSYQSLAAMIKEGEEEQFDEEGRDKRLEDAGRYEPSTSKALNEKGNVKIYDSKVSPKTIPNAQKAIRDLSRGDHFLSDKTFFLDKDSYDELVGGLEKETVKCFESQVRSDWNPDTGKLTLRATACWIHAGIQNSLRVALVRELDKIGESHGFKELRRNLRTDGNLLSIGTKTNIDDAHISPSDQFHDSSTKTSHFIVEILYNKKSVNIEDKVREIFEYIPSVRTILIIEVHRLRSGRKCTAQVSLWESKARDDKADHRRIIPWVNDVFLDKDKPRPGQLEIPFELFCSPGKKSQHRQSQRRQSQRRQSQRSQKMLTITYQELANMVKETIERGKPQPKRAKHNNMTIRGQTKRLYCAIDNKDGNVSDDRQDAKRPKVNNQDE
ncbi:hypothetical protein F4680DRAFT_450580 [Xylaria scruposa]|nr:hypothetical protein F4680DRAFT_450580 [Xylaria scruposa]